ncbi:uncharacterized protein LOC127008433 [Eriocheir sinensis]|uniref:uncharacterized protein LOC127008433 n=1 Tax=Eriocheir sinensis TaxID=95602 RepID=UPI0021C8188F|nr:uncharacterized protein LOC127008433 [Eriocheir sinensis]
MERLPPSTTPAAPAAPPPECLGRFPHHLPNEGDNSCRGFFECRDGLALYRRCPDELMYNAHAAPAHFPCDYPENVSCGTPAPQLTQTQMHPWMYPPPARRQQYRSRDDPTVFNFYSYVTHHW